MKAVLVLLIRLFTFGDDVFSKEKLLPNTLLEIKVIKNKVFSFILFPFYGCRWFRTYIVNNPVDTSNLIYNAVGYVC